MGVWGVSRLRPTKSMCVGCRDNFYNGNNDLGVKECWMFKTAKVVKKRRVHMDERPPWTAKPETVLDCRREPRFIFVDPKVTR